MNRRLLPSILTACLASAVAGCDYSSDTPPPADTFARPDSPAGPAAGADGAAASAAILQGDADPALMKPALLESVLSLIRTAALKPGGDNFKLVISKLNTYFEGNSAYEFALTPEARAFIKQAELPENAYKSLELQTFAMPDARHMEDCMMYHGIATRAAGNGDDLTRVRRVFDWMVRHVQLAPAHSLAAPGLGQAQVRPYDALLRGMATESEGGWSERGWLFMALCRQLGVDVGLLTYTPKGAKEPIPNAWICAALIDGKLYLFDPRLGLAVPGPGGEGVATLDDALADPTVLGRLDLPGQSSYRPTRDMLAESTSRIGILIDSSPGFLSPRMRLLEQSLSGKDRTILYRDPVDQGEEFVKALGAHSGGVKFWPLPLMVQTLLFTSGKFVDATQQALFLFRPEFPLLYARVKQLRGELPEAIGEYMNLRYAPNPMLMDKRHRMPPDIQQAMDMCSTYFLALAHLEQGDAGNAGKFFEATLRLLPAPGPNQPYYNMFRWGAQTNLAKLHEAKGETDLAIAYYAQADLTPQHHGNLFRARELIWRNPTATLPDPLPQPPSADPAPALAPVPVPVPAPDAPAKP